MAKLASVPVDLFERQTVPPLRTFVPACGKLQVNNLCAFAIGMKSLRQRQKSSTKAMKAQECKQTLFPMPPTTTRISQMTTQGANG